MQFFSTFYAGKREKIIYRCDIYISVPVYVYKEITKNCIFCIEAKKSPKFRGGISLCSFYIVYFENYIFYIRQKG